MEMMQGPLPRLTDWNRPFFAGGLSGKLVLQRCARCAKLIYYPRIVCPHCLSNSYQWEALSGRGTVYSFAIVWRPQHPSFLSKVPITLAVVQLAEGIQMVSTVINCSTDAVHIDMEVRAVFDNVAEDIALVKFEPVT